MMRPSLLERDVQPLFIDGAWQAASGGRDFETDDPSTGKLLARVARGGVDDVDRAVRAAVAAREGEWARMSPSDRQALLLRFADLIETHMEELVVLDTLEMGAPIARLPIMLARSPGVVRYYAGLARTIHGQTLGNSTPGQVLTYTQREPVGVVGAIIPWNAPMPAALIKICPALAAGCTLVLKPSEDASLSSIRLVELLEEAGVPRGVVNLVTGYGSEAGAALAAHPGVDKMAFTGSTVTGRAIIEASKVNLKRLSLELGGKSPDILFDDANLDKAVPGVAMGAFGNTGQVCFAGTRLFVQRGIVDEVVARLADFTAKLKVGAASDPETQLGPIASQRQLDRVLGYLEVAGNEGAEPAAGGARLSGSGRDDGYFVAPTVLTEVRDDMRVAQEEIFGPVVSVLPFDDEDEVVRRSNASPFGLAAGIWTRDLGRAHRVSQGLKCGTVWVNTYGLMDPAVPMGGFKESGYGREYGPEHLDAFLETKSVWINVAP